jgi:hypothetical protein
MCNASWFTQDFNDIECMGLYPTDATSPADCAKSCCDIGANCEIWQFCDYGAPNAKCTTKVTDKRACWVGKYDQRKCAVNPGWLGGGMPTANQLFHLDDNCTSTTSSGSKCQLRSVELAVQTYWVNTTNKALRCYGRLLKPW